jgi:MFS transporter, putative metabolite:H+ symporter
LLLLRVSVFESGMFGKIKNNTVSRGNFFMLFQNKYLFIKYLKCILIGLPTWFVLGQLVTLAPEFAKNFGMTDAPENPGAAVMWCYVGLIVGDLASGLLSQYLKSRRKALLSFIAIATFTTSFYLLSGDISRNFFYFKVFLLGIGMGYWALFVMVGAEHFGTNIRATVTTTVPNFARGLLVPIAAIMKILKDSIGLVNGAWVMFIVTFVIAALAMYFMEETFGKDLDYVEE